MKRPRSFRFRLAAISMATSGLVLLAFGAVSGWILYRDRVRMLDRELTDFGCRVAGRAGRNVSGAQIRLSLSDRIGEERATHRFLCLFDRSGTILYRDANWPPGLDATAERPGDRLMDPQPVVQDMRPRDEARQPPARMQYEPSFRFFRSGDVRARIAAFGNDEVIVVLGADLAPIEAEIRALGMAFGAALPAALIVVAAGALIVARRALKPIFALGARMETLSAHGLDQRIEIERADAEFRRIIAAFNAMMERLERSFHQANRFSADASHELRTPLAVMQGTIEHALAICPAGSEIQQSFSALLDEVVRQRRILDSLLLLSRADAGQLPLHREPVRFSDMVLSLIEDAELHAEARRIELRKTIEGGLVISADQTLLRRAVENLLSNAVKHNIDGGWIECRLAQVNGFVELTLSNSGDSIPAGDRALLFQRFYRGGNAKGRSLAGAGLGLSLAREITIAHGGSVVLDEASPEGVTTFRLRLPHLLVECAPAAAGYAA